MQIVQLIEGKASAYVFASPGCKKWDTCAPEAILHAVGGKIQVGIIKMSKCVLKYIFSEVENLISVHEFYI